MGAEQPLAALRRHLCIGCADQEGSLRFGDDLGLGEYVRADHRSEDDKRLVFENAIHRVQRIGAGSSGILRRQRQLFPADASASVDFIDREFDAVARLRAEQCEVARERSRQAQRYRRGTACGVRFRFGGEGDRQANRGRANDRGLHGYIRHQHPLLSWGNVRVADGERQACRNCPPSLPLVHEPLLFSGNPSGQGVRGNSRFIFRPLRLWPGRERPRRDH
ncbi:hypothetical protein GALL_549270 [mine drainage metagenome]|uniref:Uncharacterized protein n=1 Tax=mine drainage metagenome TaxID=410659 RepID=A0A1J5P7U4_9ZZZZ